MVGAARRALEKSRHIFLKMITFGAKYTTLPLPCPLPLPKAGGDVNLSLKIRNLSVCRNPLGGKSARKPGKDRWGRKSPESSPLRSLRPSPASWPIYGAERSVSMCSCNLFICVLMFYSYGILTSPLRDSSGG